MHTRFWWGNVKESGSWDGQGFDGRIILKRILRRFEDRDTGRALVEAVTRLRVT
jgi:hypothetical protein